MKYILLGTISEQWAAKHAERVTRAKAKLQELKITLESVYYTQVRLISSMWWRPRIRKPHWRFRCGTRK
ncbi:MAG: hypothetical protein ACREYF_16530 [Gammaproteobacteria bacterium]